MIAVLGAIVITACASKPPQLMPTPVIYQQPGGVALFTEPGAAGRSSTDVELLYLTDRGEETDPESSLPYGQTRAGFIGFGRARVRIGSGLPWAALAAESRLAERTRDLELSLGRVAELGRFPDEPYDVERCADGNLYRGIADRRQHDQAERLLREEVQRQLARSPSKEVVLYVHGFHETFATAAFRIAELCHFLGREPVCAFFTWPASSTGNFLISYTNTTESARYAELHLRKVIRLLATTPGVERLQLLAHSRGSALLMSALRDLLLEAIAAGREPATLFNIDNVLLFSPDIDVDLAAQDITASLSDPSMISDWSDKRLPRGINGRLTIYSSPQDRALFFARILFRSESRLGNIRPEDISAASQAYLAQLGNLDVVIYEGRRTDAFGHSYFTTNPRVSSDVIQLLRFGKRPGEPGRDLIQLGPVVWRFPD